MRQGRFEPRPGRFTGGQSVTSTGGWPRSPAFHLSEACVWPALWRPASSPGRRLFSWDGLRPSVRATHASGPSWSRFFWVRVAWPSLFLVRGRLDRRRRRGRGGRRFLRRTLRKTLLGVGGNRQEQYRARDCENGLAKKSAPNSCSKAPNSCPLLLGIARSMPGTTPAFVSASLITPSTYSAPACPCRPGSNGRQALFAWHRPR